MTSRRYVRAVAVYRDTSRAAWEAVLPHLSEIDQRILMLCASPDGATSDEIERHAHLRHQTVSAQISHMARAGLLQDSGDRRKNANGRACIVWRLAERRPQPVEAQPSLWHPTWR